MNGKNKYRIEIMPHPLPIAIGTLQRRREFVFILIFASSILQ
jgi:hypothetical protein